MKILKFKTIIGILLFAINKRLFCKEINDVPVFPKYVGVLGNRMSLQVGVELPIGRFAYGIAIMAP